MRVLVAPDRFSGAVTSVTAAHALAEGWRRQVPTDTTTEVAMSDGAAGLLDAVAAARGGRLVPLTSTGPRGRPCPATVLHVTGSAGGTAYVEADQVLGTHLVPDTDRVRALRTASTAPLADLLRAALATRARRVVIGLPVTAAVHDGGAGLLAALAVDAGVPADTVPGALRSGPARLSAAAGAAADLLGPVREHLAGVEIVLAVADQVPLLGLLGAGALLGQDPVVGPATAQELERALGGLAHALERRAAELPVPRRSLGLAGTAPATVRPARADGSGAGGGAGFVLQLLGARALPGAEVVAEAVGLADAVAAADLVLTGARRLTAHDLAESVVATVARSALPHALPVVVVAEEVHTSRREVSPLGISGCYDVLDPGRRHAVARPPADGPHTDLPAQLAARAARVARTWSH